MTLSFSWWHGAFVHFIANSSSEMHFKSLPKLVWEIWSPLDPSWPSHPLQTILLVSAQQDESYNTVFPAPHLPYSFLPYVPSWPSLPFALSHQSLAQSRNLMLLKLRATERIQGPFCVSLKFHSFKCSSSSFSTPQTGPTPQYWHPEIAKVPNFPGVELVVSLLFSRPSFPPEGLSCAGHGDRPATSVAFLTWETFLDCTSCGHQRFSHYALPSDGACSFQLRYLSFLTIFFLYKRWKQKTLKIIAGHCMMCENSSGTAGDWKATF